MNRVVLAKNIVEIAKMLAARSPDLGKDEDGFAEVSFRVKGDAVHSMLRLLRHCERVGNMGHSFEIVLDPENSEYRKTVGFDGDGSDRIESIKVNGKLLPKDYKE